MRLVRILGSILALIALTTDLALGAPTKHGTVIKPTQSGPLSDADIYKKDLPSIIFIDEKAKDGNQYAGSGFMAVKDGVAVTCWHMVHNAKSVTARFSDGEVYDVVGLIDHDAVNDVAIVKVKETGRPLLTLQKDAPEIGAKALAIGAPLGQFDFTISDGIISQIRHNPYVYQFTCPATHGNSGGPLLNANGQVIGIVAAGVDNSSANLGFAVPIKYALNLDETLPVTPWSKVKDDTQSNETASASNSDLDKELAQVFLDQDDGSRIFIYFQTLMTQRDTLPDAVPPDVYVMEDALKDDIKALTDSQSDDPARERIRVLLIDNSQHLADALDMLAKGLVIGESDPSDKSALDLFSRAMASFQENKTPSRDDMDVMLKSKDFILTASELIKDIRDKPLQWFGIITMHRKPDFVCIVTQGLAADQMGIKPGDSLVSVDGQAAADCYLFSKLVQQDIGKLTDIVVMRNGQKTELNVAVPHPDSN